MGYDSQGGPASVRVVLVTVPDPESGREMVRQVVEAGLAACGNLVPGLTSVYRWAGEVQEDAEVLLVLKTTEEALPELMDRVVELHPYEVPEFLALPVSAGHVPYLQWVVDEVSKPESIS